MAFHFFFFLAWSQRQMREGEMEGGHRGYGVEGRRGQGEQEGKEGWCGGCGRGD